LALFSHDNAQAAGHQAGLLGITRRRSPGARSLEFNLGEPIDDASHDSHAVRASSAVTNVVTSTSLPMRFPIRPQMFTSTSNESVIMRRRRAELRNSEPERFNLVQLALPKASVRL